MGLVDANNNQLPSSTPADDRKTMDVRAAQTGTVIYNLIVATTETIGLGNAIEQIKHALEQQKVLVEPPQLTAMYARLREMDTYRFLFAKELNERFAEVDAMRRAKLGLETSPVAKVDLTESEPPANVG